MHVRVAAQDAVIASGEAAGRDKDLRDLPLLRALRARRAGDATG